MGLVKVQDVVSATSELTFVSVSHILGPKRPRRYAHPRQLAMSISRQMTDLSLPQIGRQFNRDHTTILHAIRAVERRQENNLELQLLIAQIKELSLERASARARAYIALQESFAGRGTLPREAAVSGSATGNGSGIERGEMNDGPGPGRDIPAS